MTVTEQSWQQLFMTAQMAVEKQQWLTAEPLLRQTIEHVPQHASAHHLLGKVLLAQGQRDQALAAQQQSCLHDPGLGWNWFAAGELFLDQKDFKAAVEAFEQALAALPAEGWIQEQLCQSKVALELNGEQLSDGIGNYTYSYWIQHHEPKLPAQLAPLAQAFWLLEAEKNGSQHWRSLHSSADLQPAKAPLGDSPWPVDGWLVLLGPNSKLRPGAMQAMESWLAGGLKEQRAQMAVEQMNPLNSNTLQEPDLIYADEDRLDENGERSNPWFKPGWVEESFWSSPWLSNLSMWRMSWLRHQQLPLPPADSAGRFDWLLKALELQPKIAHLPLVLVHTRKPADGNGLALKTHLKRQGEAIEVVRPHPQLSGCFQLQWALPKSIRCSVIIPTRDRADLLQQCLSGLWQTTTSARAHGIELDILVVDNGSVELATTALLSEWQKKLTANFQVLRINSPFNWSQLNNQAAAIAQGELLLLLNNDIETIEPGWLEAMASQAIRPRVGCVGALLLYPNGNIQHGGVIVGMHSGADHAYRDLKPAHNVHRSRSQLLTSWGAVTGACMMLRKALLEEVGGFDEGLPVEFNDVDLCLRLGQLGYRHVIPPDAVLLHHESKSRDSKQSQTALQALKRVQQRWLGRFAQAGPWWPAQSERNCADGRPLGLEGMENR